ncbi:MAG: bifunctional oligoribonuclease/PAP phosphatase NrnA [Candidatus Omnitrophota bacterium]
MGLKKIVAQIKNHNNFLISSHVNMEGDALGSELAFGRLIKLLGKNAVIVNEDKVPYGYGFLPGINGIKKYKDNLKGIKFDCFVALDCSDIKRTGEVYRMNKENKPVLNIDHHISNTKFGTFNWVDPYASSACEMVYELYKKMKVRLDKDAALYLYAGILTDTGSFRYSNTTAATHKIAAELLGFGINVVEVYKNVYGNLPFNEMKLVTHILNNIKRRNNGKVVWFEADSRLLKKYKAQYVDLTDYVMNFGRAIDGVEVVVLFKENLGVKNEVRVNFRSQGKIDVNAIAQGFGGGGHRGAAGCTLHGALAGIKKQVLKKVDAAFAKEKDW